MTDASQPPKIPWWVSYWTDPGTTRASLRQETWFFFIMTTLSLGVGTFFLFWSPAGFGVVVLPVAFVVLPVGLIFAGVWTLAATSWIDRHQAWDRLDTRQEREAYEESRSLVARSLPLGFLLLVAGGTVGALVGSVWETEVGIPVGLGVGALGGLVLGLVVAGFREGLRSSAGKSVEVKSQDPPRD